MILKRFVFKDPYAPVSLSDLIRLSLWKLAIVYLALFALLVQLWLSREKGWLLALAITSAPALFFILVLFEPSGHERYFAIFTVLFLAAASVIGGDVHRPKRILQGMLALLLIALVPANAKSYFELRRSAEMTAALNRIQGLRQVLTPHSIVVVLSFRDGLSQYLERERFPFDPAVAKFPPVHTLIEAGTLRTLHWRMEFAQRALDSWEAGGDVWISRRLFASRPLPQWNWVEDDDRRVHWTDIPAFFGHAATDMVISGDDGFVRLAHTESNRQWLSGAAR